MEIQLFVIIIEEAKETVVGFPKGTGKVLQLYFILT